LGDSIGLQLVAKFATVNFSSETLLEGKAEGRTHANITGNPCNPEILGYGNVF
jgi:hypothetical protein